MSSADSGGPYEYGPGTFEVPERGSIRIRGCPPSIDSQLQRAQFDRESSTTFVKTQPTLDEGDDEFRVVTVRLDGEVMTVEARGNVGVVSLTPRSKLHIEPKIPWEHIFDILLAVHGRKRSVEYHGVPLEQFRSEDIELEDIFLILAINYLNGMEAIHRNGFVRRLETKREDLDRPRGVIDIERSLLNQAEGRTQQHCLLKEVNYDNPANSLLHYAGQHLLRLFQRYEDEYDHQAYYHIFSQVHQEVRHLEGLDVDSGRRRIPEYQRFGLHDLPKQRHYYQQALDVAKTIVSSSLGTPSSMGERELVVDYVLNMESLFEQYSQVAIEDELERIRAYDHLDQTADVAAARSPTVKPFEGESNVYHQPDHAVEEGEETLAVLDSKYYAEDKDPVTSGGSRSRLFSYAYLLDADHMCFLTPLNEPRRRKIPRTGAELEVVAPHDGGEFTLDGYHESVAEYLHRVLSNQYPALEVFRAVQEHGLCLDGVSDDDLDRVNDPDGPFGFGNVRAFSLKTVNAAASHSRAVSSRSELEQGGKWTRQQVDTLCENRDPETTTCVPVFRRDGRDERIDLYFVNVDGSVPMSVEMQPNYKLL